MLDQLLLMDTEQFQMGSDFTSDDYETPASLAREIVNLIRPTERRIIEPAAGSGMIAQFLPSGSVCLEIKTDRVQKGKVRAPHCEWSNQGFFSFDETGFDLVIGNPPFSTAMLFLEKSLRILNPENPEARVLFLLPTNFFQTKSAAKQFKSFGAHIHHKYEIVGRVFYLKEGVEQTKRQVDDAVFDIRLGAAGDAVSYIWR